MSNLVTRFPNGVNNTSVGDWNQDMAITDPLKNIVFFEDFAGPNVGFPLATSGLAAASNSVWTITVTEGGAGDATSAVTTDAGGALKLTTDAADNDLIFVQNKWSPFTFSAGKACYFKTRFKLTDATANAASVNESEFYFGLMVLDTDPLSSTAGDGVTDGMFFMKEDGTQNVNFYVQKNATTGQLTTSSVTTITVNTYTTLAFAYDGSRFVKLYKDDAYLATVDLTTTQTDYLPDAALTISFGVKNGEAVAKVLTVDYLFCAMER